MSIFTNLESDFESWWTNHVKPVLTNDVEPVLKSFIQQFDSQFGQQAINPRHSGSCRCWPTRQQAWASPPPRQQLATFTLYTQAKADAASDATLDATQILQTVQSALQVAKAANNVVTPADQTAAAAIAAPMTDGPTNNAA